MRTKVDTPTTAELLATIGTSAATDTSAAGGTPAAATTERRRVCNWKDVDSKSKEAGIIAETSAKAARTLGKAAGRSEIAGPTVSAEKLGHPGHDHVSVFNFFTLTYLIHLFAVQCIDNRFLL